MLKKQYKVSLIVILMLIMIVTLVGTSMAATDYTCNVSLESNKTNIKKGESVTILVKATGIQAGEGIASFNAILDYNSNIFECNVSGDDEGNWQKQGLIQNSLSMTRSDLLANSSDQTIAKIVLKAKENASIGKQTFKLTQIEFSTGEETFNVTDASAELTIVDNNNDDESNGNGTTENPSGSGNTGSTEGKPSGNGSGSTTSSNKPSTIAKTSTSNKVIPKAGMQNMQYVVIGGTILGVIASVVFYIKYKRTY